ncbi:MAG: VWA domain-containing protein [Chloroflexi bacterium]|nr:VWA domain-containing protein [Chloroflexota bacterium]
MIDNSQSVSTGEGTLDKRPTDPVHIRLRLTHFVIHALSISPTSANQRVGAISFAGSTETLMPLTPVLDWSKADFAEIRAVRQTGGTDFTRALNTASNMLTTDCSPDVRRCDIIMITDGIFERYNARKSQGAVQDTLQDLQSRGIFVHILTFSVGDQKWQEFLADNLISTYQFGLTSTHPDHVYSTVLHDLGLGALLTGLTPIEIAGEETIPLRIHEFHTWTRYQILPDSPLTVTFLHAGQVVMPIIADTEYTLFQPKAGEWSIHLEGNGLAYYRQTGKGVADLALHLHMPEGTLSLGKAVAIHAGISAGGTPVTDPTLFTVTATINGVTNTLAPLELAVDETIDLLTTTVPSDWFEKGTYTLTLTAQSHVPDLHVQPTTGQFEMTALPTLAMVVTPTEMTQPRQPVHVIVTVGNWQPEYDIPRLQIYGPGEIRVVTPTWSTRETGVFTSIITTPFDVTSSFAVAALLVGRTETSRNKPFDTIQTPPQLVEYAATTPVIVAPQYPIWLLIPLCTVLAIGAYACWRFYSANKHRRRERRIKRLRDEVEALALVMGEIPEEPGTIVESWNT